VDRRTISRRDGRRAPDRAARQRIREAIEARWWKKGRRRESKPPQFRIQSECALTYMNAVIRKNLTDALAVGANDVDTAFDTSGAFGDGRDRARFCRTIATCIWGVSDPLPGGPGAGSGGWQRGSLTPQTRPSLLRTSAATETRAAKSAARFNAVKWLTRKDIEKSSRRAASCFCRRIRARAAREGGGTLLPRLRSPLFFFAFADSDRVQRRESSRPSSIATLFFNSLRDRGTS
jgi:hypothetical protein